VRYRVRVDGVAGKSVRLVFDGATMPGVVITPVQPQTSSLDGETMAFLVTFSMGTKQIITIIQPARFHVVTKALNDIGIDFFTLRDVRMISGKAEIKNGSQDSHNTPKVLDGLEIMIVAQSEQVQKVIDALLMSAWEDFQSMNGGIIVMTVEEMIQVNIENENQD
jgi:nitrogen regulatory protein PII